MARFAVRLVAPVIALMLMSCGEEQQNPEPGRLVVQKSLAGGPVFIEGSITHLRVVDEDGTAIVDGLRPVRTLDVPIFERALPRGSYEVTAVERPCAGTCDTLDPPVRSTRCEIEANVSANRTTRVAIVLSAASGDADSECSVTSPR